MKRTFVWFAAFAVLFTSVPAFIHAHHGWGGNEDKDSELTGTVQQGVSLAGPHATMKIKTADGRLWDLTLAPPFRTEQAGLKEGDHPGRGDREGPRPPQQGREQVRDEDRARHLERQDLQRLSRPRVIREAMLWLQGSALGHFMRDTGPWTYALVNLSHILGIATLFGSVLILDLRLLGCWRRVPLAHVSAVTEPVTTIAFGIAAVSGLGLLATKATDTLATRSC